MDSSRIWVEAWSPEYGFSQEADRFLPVSEEEVDPYVERPDWSPVVPGTVPDRELVFTDGVSRVDARAFFDEGSGVVPGIFGSVAAGAAIVGERARFASCQVRRWMIAGPGSCVAPPAIDASMSYSGRSAGGILPEELSRELQDAMTTLEADLGKRLVSEGFLVIADGPLRIREPVDLVGYIKSHRRSYLASALEPVVVSLGVGERTPIFRFGRIRPRYSWYTRIGGSAGEHPWAGIARAEVSFTVGLARAVSLADLVTHRLPGFASKAFWDSRAPQNLVPIAGLERKLWSLLGDKDLILRRIRSAVRAG